MMHIVLEGLKILFRRWKTVRIITIRPRFNGEQIYCLPLHQESKLAPHWSTQNNASKIEEALFCRNRFLGPWKRRRWGLHFIQIKNPKRGVRVCGRHLFSIPLVVKQKICSLRRSLNSQPKYGLLISADFISVGHDCNSIHLM